MHPTALLTTLLTFLLSLQVASIFATPTPHFKNGPVISTNFQDPSLIQVNETWYAFAGANGNPPNINVQIATSSDFSTWTVTQGYDALPTLTSWATNPGHLPDGSFIIYYSASTKLNPRQHCIGAAISGTIAGPYTALNETITCDHSKGGAIDPDGFVDINSSDAAHYFVYIVDGNSIGHGGACENSKQPIVPTTIMLQRVSSSDGYTLIGDPVELLHNIPVDGPNIEAPALYRIEYATSKTLTGPYIRNPKPLLVTGDTAAHVQNPGGIDFSANGSRAIFQGDLNMAWFKETGVHHQKGDRGMYAASIVMNENNAQVVGLY